MKLLDCMLMGDFVTELPRQCVKSRAIVAIH